MQTNSYAKLPDLKPEVSEVAPKRKSRRLSEIIAFIKKHRPVFTSIAAVILVVIILFVTGVLGSKAPEPPQPHLLYVELDGNNATIRYEVASDYVIFCISEEENLASCKWQNSEYFELPNEGTYFATVKEYKTGLLSDTVKFDYQKLNPFVKM
ncbi:hypothetical protein IJH29_00505 [Candidatus Saccharibacteria bacterium]|nr:hypothetical protein [Candidatus Saccharibacteria bacterium]